MEPDNNEAEFSFESMELSDEARAIEAFDGAQTELLATVGELFETPRRPEIISLMNSQMTDLVLKFKSCVQLIKQNDDRDGNIATVTQIILEEEQKRINRFVTLAPRSADTFSRYKREEVLEEVGFAFNTEEGFEGAIVEALSMYFAKGIENDFKNIMQYIPKESTPIMKVIGKHALDTLKISVGVTAGGVAAYYIIELINNR